MDWRQWLYDQLTSNAALTAVVQVADIRASGSLKAPPSRKPYIVIRTGAETEELNDGDAPLVTSQSATIWIHDEPGSFDRIDSILALVRDALIGAVTSPNGIACIWQGNSGELADASLGTITRNSSFRLVGSVA